MGGGNRWVLLEHINDPCDLSGRHYDLLLEDGMTCRSWRLKKIPVLDGPAVQVIPSTTHKLAWLEKLEAPVSGGRGFAKRIFSGVFNGFLPDTPSRVIRIYLDSQKYQGFLEIAGDRCRLKSKDFNASKSH